MWWWTEARAQEEACAPVAAAVLEEHLGAAESALAARRPGDARSRSAAAREAARCLDAPVPRPALGRLAWVEAELAAESLDEGLAWEWIRLAQSVGAASPPDRVPADAALREALEAAPPPVGEGGPTGVALAIPERGTVYADGAPLTAPRLTTSTPHLVQVFGKDGRVGGDWQMGGSFPAHLLVYAEGAARPSRDRPAADLPPDGWKPRKEGTEAAYREWIAKHPQGPYAVDAQEAIDDLHWAAAVAAGTELAAKQYLHDHPDGLHVADARFVVEDRAYRRAMAAQTHDAWKQLLADVPEGTYATEARQQLDDLDWRDARRTDTAAAYRGYLDARPTGRYAARAAELETERIFDLARHRGDDALQLYLDKHADSPWADEARAILGEARVDQVVLELAPRDPAHAAPIEKALRAELARRTLAVVDPPGGPAAARLKVEADVVPRAGMLEARAALALWVPGLERPLFEQEVTAPLLAGDDAGAILGRAVATNLLPTERWHPEPKPAPRPAPAPAPAP